MQVGPEPGFGFRVVHGLGAVQAALELFDLVAAGGMQFLEFLCRLRDLPTLLRRRLRYRQRRDELLVGFEIAAVLGFGNPLEDKIHNRGVQNPKQIPAIISGGWQNAVDPNVVEEKLGVVIVADTHTWDGLGDAEFWHFLFVEIFRIIIGEPLIVHVHFPIFPPP